MTSRRPKGPDHDGMTLETLRQLDDMVGRTFTLIEPGDFLEDPDGRPIGVAPNVITETVMASPLIGIDVFRALGVDPADYPNLTVYDPQEDQ